jgi:hypothetical protein
VACPLIRLSSASQVKRLAKVIVKWGTWRTRYLEITKYEPLEAHIDPEETVDPRHGQ